ncbi:MAG: TetR/AcrR family transcriptional regulator [Deltaproteobacteria bacterium]|nr:TetR/AcrR family transcriptional regulator [Deltaproteobacteria bacterium]
MASDAPKPPASNLDIQTDTGVINACSKRAVRARSKRTEVVSRQEQKEQTRQRILEAARELFEAKGPEATTMREIGAKAGVTAGNIFVHFKDKSALLIESLKYMLDDELDKVLATTPWEADLITRLMHLPRQLYPFYASRPKLMRTLLRETYLRSPEDLKPLDDQLGKSMTIATTEIQRSKERGEIDPETVDFTAMMAYWSYYYTVLSEVLLPRDPPDVEGALATMELLLKQLVHGIGPRSS